MTRTTSFVLSSFAVDLPTAGNDDLFHRPPTSDWGYAALVPVTDVLTLLHEAQTGLNVSCDISRDGYFGRFAALHSESGIAAFVSRIQNAAVEPRHIEFKDPITRDPVQLRPGQFNEEYILDLIQRLEEHLYQRAATYLPQNNLVGAKQGSQYIMGMLESGSLGRVQKQVFDVIRLFADLSDEPEKASVFSHHIKNIVTVLVSHLSMIELDYQTPKCIEFIHAMAKGLRQNITPRGLIDRLHSLFGEIHKLEKQKQGITAVFNSVRSSDDDVVLNAPLSPLWQVLQELVWNACKYSDSSVRIGFDGATREFYVINDGEQIPAGFDLFAAGERATQKSVEGTGLGLTGVRDLCLKYGWTLTYQSNSEGTTFRLCIA